MAGDYGKCLPNHKMHFKYLFYSFCFSDSLKSRNNIVNVILVPIYLITYRE